MPLRPIIKFDKNNNLILTRDVDISQDRFAAFGNRYVANKWCDTEFYFQSDNGIGTENFYNKVPWCEIQGFSNAKYYWGEDVAKKVEAKGYICGAAPFVYGEFLFNDPNPERKYKTVFLPKSDYPYKTNIKEKCPEMDNFRQFCLDLDGEDTIFISYPIDYTEIWNYRLPRQIYDKIWMNGMHGFDRMWIPTLQQLIRRSKVIHVPSIFSSTVAYATFMGTPIEFYDHDIYIRGTIPDDEHPAAVPWQEKISKMYTVVPSEKSPEWNTFMRYLTDCFRGDGPDKYFWLTKLLSLERVKPPEELYEDLLILHNRFLPHIKNKEDNHRFPEFPIKPCSASHNFYNPLKEKCDIIIEKSKNASDDAHRYLSEL
jgi:hypothetical protein|tara:strand:+ start:837 stop:1946 length:1110 start_codon:yes stop_codon:yes gene_type:complete